ncbi:MAG: diguanylate cyclase [Microcystaceae cyanobacterium]
MTTHLANPITQPILDETHAPLILIVDDDTFVQMQLRLYLEREGYQVAIANSGEEGLATYRTHHPDLVLLDAIMPGINGFECCKQLSQLPSAAYVPILMITALDDQQSVDYAFDVGAADYVTKPIHWAVLRQRVKRLLYQTQLQRKLQLANLHLERLAFLDGLTQISNRRHFDDRLSLEWNRALRDKSPLSLILADVDNFKAYNDTYGHQAGDSCLKEVAQIFLQSANRPTDLAARYGGEEFAMILANTDLKGAKVIAKRIQTAIRTLKIPHHTSTTINYVTLSMGIASMIPHQDNSYTALIEQADQCLYQAKRQGKNRFVSDFIPQFETVNNTSKPEN